jgi:S1-C subfamily serine protease
MALRTLCLVLAVTLAPSVGAIVAQDRPATSPGARPRAPAASPTGPATSRAPAAALPPSRARSGATPADDPGQDLVVRGPPTQPMGDLRVAHDRCVRSLVRILRDDGAIGSGWVAELAGQRVVVTNAHVVAGVRSVRAQPYDGESVVASVRFVSPRIDLAILVPERELAAPDHDGALQPVRPLEVGVGALVRGERVVLGGNPGGLFFITTEGVVAGVVSSTHDSDQACGEGHNCVVLDSEGELGSSGGPIVDHAGRVIGMLWGVYTGSSLSIAIHARTLQRELDLAALALARRRR